MKSLSKFLPIILISMVVLISCEDDINDTIQNTGTNAVENEVELSEDLNFTSSINSKSEVDNKAANVRLGSVVVFLSRESNATGSVKIKVIRSSDNRVLTTSTSLNVSALRKNSNGYSCLNQLFTKVTFNLNTTSAKVTVGEKYRVEVHCSQTAGSSEKNAVYWAMQNANVYANGCSTYSDIPLKHCGLDFSFESWNFDNNNIRRKDQSQSIKRCARPINSGNSKIAGQEFIVGQ